MSGCCARHASRIGSDHLSAIKGVLDKKKKRRKKGVFAFWHLVFFSTMGAGGGKRTHPVHLLGRGRGTSGLGFRNPRAGARGRRTSGHLYFTLLSECVCAPLARPRVQYTVQAGRTGMRSDGWMPCFHAYCNAGSVVFVFSTLRLRVLYAG